ncbi:hypothetical protein H1S01_00880 [Heliobacterium chlorum]|uniref:Phospholipase C/D domain-containing protein n=1 Tax=Heliobacterium chlorum TaxID=2698 RepID=A0ABR7SWX7_HELCL|nr:DUF6765 family protein [Heliobacterium chlorum]MBC9783058.1 hypothetical protein [Heliobacterium chlorum]
MQADFHFGVIYVLARAAGFEPKDAEVIAYSSQYVDDAKHGGFIKFNNYPMFYHLRTTYTEINKDNFDELSNQQTWIPFHFLPGNRSDKSSEFGYISSLVCRKNSDLAKAMVNKCIEEKDKGGGLYRLGIVLHVYADTWAHDGFLGTTHSLNRVTNLEDRTSEAFNLHNIKHYMASLVKKPLEEIEDNLADTIKRLWKKSENDPLDEIENKFLLGHLAALTYPDLPYKKWSYINYWGTKVERDNTKLFLEAAEEIYRVLKQYRDGNPVENTDSIPKDLKEKIEKMFKENCNPNGHIRLANWLDAIKNGHFGKEYADPALNYIPSGEGSWKHTALLSSDGADIDSDNIYTCNINVFENSHWRRFHNAVKAHLHYIINDLMVEKKVCL